MRHFLLGPLLALALLTGGCSLLTAPGPATVADQTIVDERAALGVETIYTGWVAFVETGVDLGLIKGELAGKMQAYDKRIYSYVKIARQAYDTGNTDTYNEATAAATKLVAEAMAAFQGAN